MSSNPTIVFYNQDKTVFAGYQKSGDTNRDSQLEQVCKEVIGSDSPIREYFDSPLKFQN